MDEAINKLAAYLGDRLGTKLLASEVALGERSYPIVVDDQPLTTALAPFVRPGKAALVDVDTPEALRGVKAEIEAAKVPAK